MNIRTKYATKIIYRGEVAGDGIILLQELSNRTLGVKLLYGGNEYSESSFYYLHALNQIRSQLEENGLLIACNASRLDVVQTEWLQICLWDGSVF